jgi:acyl phosphate:glycerol-3-phosphate acyltransferase
MVICLACLVVAFLIGGIPFGLLIAKSKGVDLRTVGSGNIGATNVGRTLGKKFGLLTFALDFLKGAIPVAIVVPVARLIDPTAPDAVGGPDVLRVATAMLAFLGHVFPVYLKFKGGKGVATGAGVMSVLVPWAFAVGVLTWVAVLWATRYVSAASIISAVALIVARLVEVRNDMSSGWVVTVFVFLSSAIMVIKHRSNITRLRQGIESTVKDSPNRVAYLRGMHLLAVGSWFGASLFFNVLGATPIFDSFTNVVETQPSDRTANQRIQSEKATAEEKKALASALAGAAVGPLFPRFFALAAICSWLTVLTAFGFLRMVGGKVHRWRYTLALVALVFVALGWPLSEWVGQLRMDRFHPEAARAATAKSAFGVWHLVSLANGAVLTLLSCALLVLAAKLPGDETRG